MRQLGCEIDPSTFFKCVVCEENDLGGFHPKKSPYIRTCCNHESLMDDKNAFKANLLHNLINAYDYCRADIDFDNCEQAACMHIRAARLSGECSQNLEQNRITVP
eukprot:UN00776